MTPIVSFVGRSNVGKTTFLEKLISQLTKNGIKVAVIKHTDHFDMDKPGKDTWRHAQAGAETVVISSPEQLALLDYSRQEKSIDEIAAMINGADLIITEGYKQADKPKIEVFRQAAGAELVCNPEDLLAVVTDTRLPVDVPQFDLEDPSSMTEFILKEVLQR